MSTAKVYTATLNCFISSKVKSLSLFHCSCSSRLGTAVSVMAKIPLLECLTRHSYRESLEKSFSPHPRAEDKPDGEDKGQTSSQSSILCPAEVRGDKKSPAPGESVTQGRVASSIGLQEALEEDKEQEEMDKTDASSFNVTLLDWINVQDRPNDVEAVVRKCFDSINRVSRKSSKETRKKKSLFA